MAKTAKPVRLMRVSEIATFLGMKKANCAKFLTRRGIEPHARDAGGQLWRYEDVARAKRQYERDAGKLAADERRRESALRDRPD